MFGCWMMCKMSISCRLKEQNHACFGLKNERKSRRLEFFMLIHKILLSAKSNAREVQNINLQLEGKQSSTVFVFWEISANLINTLESVSWPKTHRNTFSALYAWWSLQHCAEPPPCSCSRNKGSTWNEHPVLDWCNSVVLNLGSIETLGFAGAGFDEGHQNNN